MLVGGLGWANMTGGVELGRCAFRGCLGLIAVVLSKVSVRLILSKVPRLLLDGGAYLGRWATSDFVESGVDRYLGNLGNGCLPRLELGRLEGFNT